MVEPYSRAGSCSPSRLFPLFLPFIFEELLMFWIHISLCKNTWSLCCFSSKCFFLREALLKLLRRSFLKPEPGNVTVEISQEKQPSQGHPPQFVCSPLASALSLELCLLLTADLSCRGCLTCWEGFIPNNFQTLLPS